jgi:hypothetical protein
MFAVCEDEFCLRVGDDQLASSVRQGGIQGHIKLASLESAQDGANDRRILLHQYGDGAAMIAAGRQHGVRRSVGRSIEIAVAQPVSCCFDSGPVRKSPYDLFKSLGDGLVDFLLGKLDEHSARVKAFRPNMLV